MLPPSLLDFRRRYVTALRAPPAQAIPIFEALLALPEAALGALPDDHNGAWLIDSTTPDGAPRAGLAPYDKGAVLLTRSELHWTLRLEAQQIARRGTPELLRRVSADNLAWIAAGPKVRGRELLILAAMCRWRSAATPEDFAAATDALARSWKTLPKFLRTGQVISGDLTPMIVAWAEAARSAGRTSEVYLEAYTWLKSATPEDRALLTWLTEEPGYDEAVRPQVADLEARLRRARMGAGARIANATHPLVVAHRQALLAIARELEAIDAQLEKKPKPGEPLAPEAVDSLPEPFAALLLAFGPLRKPYFKTSELAIPKDAACQGSRIRIGKVRERHTLWLETLGPRAGQVWTTDASGQAVPAAAEPELLAFVFGSLQGEESPDTWWLERVPPKRP